MFKHFVAKVETHLEQTVKTLRADRAREYLSHMFKKFCKERGMRRQLMIRGTPQQIGIAEQRNLMLLDMVTSMMRHANLPISFLGDTLLTAANILNHVPSKSVSATSYES